MKVKSANFNKGLEKFLKIINKELSVFFNLKADEPLLFLVDHRKDLDFIFDKKTENWFVGAFKHGNIYLLNPMVFEKESSHKEDEFRRILKHEYCHAFYTRITKSHYPSWLNEGLACYISGKKLVLSRGYKDKLLDVFSYFEKTNSDIYMVGQYWVEFLLKKFGKKKFTELINSMECISNKHQFAAKFYKIYGFKFSKDYFSKFIE
ncbi:MAG: hypothetical protein PHO56_04495 [Patescibacteria group bacterium]|nr:hypothetical protein [Patescibacteria group bacterium]